MPSLRQQSEIEEAFTASHTVARALLRPGQAYADAVRMFSPYREVKEPSVRADCIAGFDRSGETSEDPRLPLRQQPAGGECDRDDQSGARIELACSLYAFHRNNAFLRHQCAIVFVVQLPRLKQVLQRVPHVADTVIDLRAIKAEICLQLSGNAQQHGRGPACVPSQEIRVQPIEARANLMGQEILNDICTWCQLAYISFVTAMRERRILPPL
jgi:hypothetical protein